MYVATCAQGFEAAHRLQDHPGKCGVLHGHSYKVKLFVESESLDDMGMVVDFSDLKKRLDCVIGGWDHSVILQEGDPLVHLLGTLNQRVVTLSYPPTAENMARHIFNELTFQGLRVVKVEVYETENNMSAVV